MRSLVSFAHYYGCGWHALLERYMSLCKRVVRVYAQKFDGRNRIILPQSGR